MASSFSERLALARAGDRSAMEELLGRWRPLLRLQARTLLKPGLASIVEPSDIVQETLTQAFRDFGQFRGRTEGEWVGWLRTMVAGHVAKTVRFHSAEKRHAERLQPLTESYTPEETLSPDQIVIDQEQAARVAAAVDALPEAMREVVIRRVFDREPFDGVARALGRSPGAVRVLWTRAIRRLRNLLGPEP